MINKVYRAIGNFSTYEVIDQTSCSKPFERFFVAGYYDMEKGFICIENNYDTYRKAINAIKRVAKLKGESLLVFEETGKIPRRVIRKKVL